MILIGQLSCEVKDVKQVANIYSKFEALPSYIKRTGPYFQVSKKEGIQAITIYMTTDDGKFNDAYDFLLDRYNSFKGVSSVSFSVERWENFTGALDILRNL